MPSNLGSSEKHTASFEHYSSCLTQWSLLWYGILFYFLVLTFMLNKLLSDANGTFFNYYFNLGNKMQNTQNQGSSNIVKIFVVLAISYFHVKWVYILNYKWKRAWINVKWGQHAYSKKK